MNRFCVAFSLLFLTNLLSAQENSAVSAGLAITLKSAQNRGVLSGYDIKILKDGSDFKIFKFNYGGKYALENLSEGNYSIVYRTIFDKEEIESLQITESKNYDITLFSDYLDYSKETHKPFIDRIQPGESYSLTFSSQGCFHNFKEEITVTRDLNTYVIQWGKKSKILTNKDLESLRQFELEMRYFDGGFCTTRETYILEYQKELVEVEDGTCNWNGGYYLKKSLFGDEE